MIHLFGRFSNTDKVLGKDQLPVEVAGELPDDAGAGHRTRPEVGWAPVDFEGAVVRLFVLGVYASVLGKDAEDGAAF